MNLLDQLAEWWLRRRGRMVLPPDFYGLAVSNCHVQSVADGVYEVTLPHGGGIAALNHSIVNAQHALWPAHEERSKC